MYLRKRKSLTREISAPCYWLFLGSISFSSIKLYLKYKYVSYVGSLIDTFFGKDLFYVIVGICLCCSVRLLFWFFLSWLGGLKLLAPASRLCILINRFVMIRLRKPMRASSLKISALHFCFKYEPPCGKTNNVVSEQVRHKLTCTVTEKS